MGLSRDKRAPKELNDVQRKEIQEDPSLVALRNKRDTYRKQLKAQGDSSLSAAEKEILREKHKQAGNEIANVRQRLLRLRLKQEIRKFYDSIDIIEIAKQLNGKEAREAIMQPAIEFEFPERGIIAAVLFKPISTEQIRIEFVYAMARLFRLRETRRLKATKRAATNSIFQTCRSSASATPIEIAHSPKKRKTSLNSKLFKQEYSLSGYEDIIDIQPEYLYPNVPRYPVCGFCYGNEQLLYKGRTKHWPRKDVRNNHISTHLRDNRYQGEFTCPYPDCPITLDGATHFIRHSLEAHKIAH
jgi:hypothetical protein